MKYAILIVIGFLILSRRRGFRCLIDDYCPYKDNAVNPCGCSNA